MYRACICIVQFYCITFLTNGLMLTFTPEHVQHLMDRTNCGVPLRDLYQTTVSGLAGVTEHCHFIAQICYCWLRFHIRHLHLSHAYLPFYWNSRTAQVQPLGMTRKR